MPPKKEDTPKGVNSLPDAAAYEHLKDSIGRFRTQSLFVEHKHDKYPAPFTLKDYDHNGGLSMYILYMNAGDPTEYTQAISLLGSWKHWQLLTKTEWFKPIVNAWRDELRVKFESDRFAEMKDVAEECKGTPQGVQATKWLAERYSTVSNSTRGRPSKAEKVSHLKKEAEEEQLLKEEAERLGL
jgi:hypothetical protein